MDRSLSNYELTDSTIKSVTDSESGSDPSETIEIVGYGDVVGANGANLGANLTKAEENFDNNLPETVTLLTHNATGAKVYLVGTAHFSKESQADVEKVIREVEPHIVVVELCPSRTSILRLDEKTILEEAKKIDTSNIIQLIKANGAINGIMYILLLNMSAHITKETGMAPGGEFRVANREAAKLQNCIVHLGDRPIEITLRRALSKLTWFQTIKLAWHLITSKDPISVEDIEKCKNRDMLEQILEELAGEYPAFREVLLDERDIYLTNTLQTVAKLTPKSADPLRIVGVVGIGHTPGIIRLWPVDQESFIPNIMAVPPPSLSSKIVKLSFRIGLLGLGGYIIYKVIPFPVGFKENVQAFIQKAGSNVFYKRFVLGS